MSNLSCNNTDICDKNSPPNVWSDVGSICYKTNSIAFCIIPGGKAFTTTELKIRRFNTNDSNSSSSSTFLGNDMVYYPFSLHYLAFCIYNVLQRTGDKGQDHCKRLDVHNDECACMTIIRFFSFYKNITAEKFVGKLSQIKMHRYFLSQQVHIIQKDLFIMKMQKESAMHSPTPIYVPLFKSDYTTLPMLPFAIESVLRDALKLQFEIDTKHQQNHQGKNKRMHKESKQDMEFKIREAFDGYPMSTLFKDILEDVNKTKADVLSQITEYLTKLDDFGNDKPDIDEQQQGKEDHTAKSIKYVSIDVPVEEIYKFLEKNYNPTIKEFFEQTGYDVKNIPKSHSTGNNKGYRIFDTHVTMSHSSSSTQTEMKSKFQSLLNMNVPIYIKNFYFSKRIAALGVDVSGKTLNEPFAHVPSSTNAWTHITLWVGKDENTLMDVEKKESNNLPKMNLVSKAREVRFRDPGVVNGTLKFIYE